MRNALCKISLSSYPALESEGFSRDEKANGDHAKGARTCERKCEASQPVPVGWADWPLKRRLHRAFEEDAQLARTRRMAQLAQRLGFDLPDALAAHRESLAHFL